MSAAGEVAELDHERAARPLLEATRAALYAGDRHALVSTGRRAQALRKRAGETFELTVSAGLGLVWEEDGTAGRKLLDEAIAQAEQSPHRLEWAARCALQRGDETTCARLLAAGGRARSAGRSRDRACHQPLAPRFRRDPRGSIRVRAGERGGRARASRTRSDSPIKSGITALLSAGLPRSSDSSTKRSAKPRPRFSSRELRMEVDGERRVAGARRIGAWARPLGRCSHPLREPRDDGLSVPRATQRPEPRARSRPGRPARCGRGGPREVRTVG